MIRIRIRTQHCLYSILLYTVACLVLQGRSWVRPPAVVAFGPTAGCQTLPANRSYNLTEQRRVWMSSLAKIFSPLVHIFDCGRYSFTQWHCNRLFLWLLPGCPKPYTPCKNVWYRGTCIYYCRDPSRHFFSQSRRLLTKIVKSEATVNWKCRCWEFRGEGP